MAIALHYAARSNLGLGPKSRNEDSAYAGPNLLVLADGMGGHAAGDVASSMIVGELAPLDTEDIGADQAIAKLETSLRSANAKLSAAMRENPDLAGMGSTTIALLRTGTKLAMAHIGDSRAFLLRGDALTQITKDHSFVQQLVDEGRISEADAATHPQRSVVTRVMTGQPDDDADTSLREAKPGDRLLICSDGLSDFVATDVIEEILRDADTAPAAADRCIEVALKASTRDNVTVIVADVVDADDGAGLPNTVPEVVGAAAKRLPRRRRTRAIPTSPAEKAAALSREAAGMRRADDDDGDDGDENGVELAEEPKRGAASKVVRRTIGGLVVLAVLGVGLYAAWTWSQRQYFVGAQDGKVAIFRGMSQDLGPISLSHVESASDVAVTDLPTDLQTSVANTIAATDLADAQTKVDRLWFEAVQCRVLAATGTPCGGLPVTEPAPLPITTSASTGPPPVGATVPTPSGTVGVSPSQPGGIPAGPTIARPPVAPR